MAKTTEMPKNVSTARMKLLFSQPFFASMLLASPLKVDRSLWRMATDGNAIIYNPEACAELSVAEIQTILCHEVLHIGFHHIPTMQKLKLDRRLWNEATDYAINLVLVETGMPMYQNGLLDHQYKGLTALQIYDRLLQKQEAERQRGGGRGNESEGTAPNPNGPSSGGTGGDQSSQQPSDHGKSDKDGAPGGSGWDLVEPEHGIDSDAAAQAGREVQQRVAQAANMARMAGKMPAGLDRLITEMLEPVVPWPTVLQDYMTRVSKDDETWSRRNRRFPHVTLPARHSERMGEVIFIGDTSGSISGPELQRMASEVASIAEQVKPECVRLLWADTKVVGEQVFECGEAVVCEPKGGGGTDMRVPLSYAEQFDPQVVILATDGYTPWPDSEPPYPLIVLCTTDTKVPIGQVIRV